MQIATLILSGIGAATGTASLLILMRAGREAQKAKAQIENEIEKVKTKVNHNARVVKTALSAIEL